MILLKLFSGINTYTPKSVQQQEPSFQEMNNLLVLRNKIVNRPRMSVKSTLIGKVLAIRRVQLNNGLSTVVITSQRIYVNNISIHTFSVEMLRIPQIIDYKSSDGEGILFQHTTKQRFYHLTKFNTVLVDVLVIYPNSIDPNTDISIQYAQVMSETSQGIMLANVVFSGGGVDKKTLLSSFLTLVGIIPTVVFFQYKHTTYDLMGLSQSGQNMVVLSKGEVLYFTKEEIVELGNQYSIQTFSQEVFLQEGQFSSILGLGFNAIVFDGDILLLVSAHTVQTTMTPLPIGISQNLSWGNQPSLINYDRVLRQNTMYLSFFDISDDSSKLKLIGLSLDNCRVVTTHSFKYLGKKPTGFGISSNKILNVGFEDGTLMAFDQNSIQPKEEIEASFKTQSLYLENSFSEESQYVGVKFKSITIIGILKCLVTIEIFNNFSSEGSEPFPEVTQDNDSGIYTFHIKAEHVTLPQIKVIFTPDINNDFIIDIEQIEIRT